MPRQASAAEVEDVKRFVRRLYEETGVRSQGELAARMQVSPSQVSDWLNPGRPNIPDGHNLFKLIRLAQELPTETQREQELHELVGEMGEIRDLLRTVVAHLDGQGSQADARDPS